MRVIHTERPQFPISPQFPIAEMARITSGFDALRPSPHKKWPSPANHPALPPTCGDSPQLPRPDAKRTGKAYAPNWLAIATAVRAKHPNLPLILGCETQSQMQVPFFSTRASLQLQQGLSIGIAAVSHDRAVRALVSALCMRSFRAGRTAGRWWRGANQPQS